MARENENNGVIALLLVVVVLLVGGFLFYQFGDRDGVDGADIDVDVGEGVTLDRSVPSAPNREEPAAPSEEP